MATASDATDVLQASGEVTGDLGCAPPRSTKEPTSGYCDGTKGMLREASVSRRTLWTGCMTSEGDHVAAPGTTVLSRPVLNDDTRSCISPHGTRLADISRASPSAIDVPRCEMRWAGRATSRRASLLLPAASAVRWRAALSGDNGRLLPPQGWDSDRVRTWPRPRRVAGPGRSGLQDGPLGFPPRPVSRSRGTARGRRALARPSPCGRRRRRILQPGPLGGLRSRGTKQQDPLGVAGAGEETRPKPASTCSAPEGSECAVSRCRQRRAT